MAQKSLLFLLKVPSVQIGGHLLKNLIPGQELSPPPPRELSCAVRPFKGREAEGDSTNPELAVLGRGDCIEFSHKLSGLPSCPKVVRLLVEGI